jgi:phage gp45-like
MNPTDNMIIRGRIVDTRDDGKQQAVQVKGRANETYGDRGQYILRIQAHGFNGHAPKGSLGMILCMGGNNDQAMMLDGEHPDHRPTSLEEGASRQYDTNGNYHEMNSTQQHIVASKDLIVEVASNQTETVQGTATETVNGASKTINVQSGTLYLNVQQLVITAQHVVVDCPSIDLGGQGGAPVIVAGPYPLYGQFSTRVRAL